MKASLSLFPDKIGNQIYVHVRKRFDNNGRHMNTMTDFLSSTFSFMSAYGFHTVSCNDEGHVICFTMPSQSLTVFVDYNEYEYEVLCYFTVCCEYAFSLQEVMNFAGITDKSGEYQVSTHDDLIDGITYIADALQSLLQKIGALNEQLLSSIREYVNSTRKTKLDDYYCQIDIMQAEKFWQSGDYNASKRLFKKHRNKLSKSQLLKLEYAEKHSTI